MHARSNLRLHALFATLLPGLAVAAVACGGTTTGSSSGSSEDGGSTGDGGPFDPIFETLTEKLCLSSDESLFGFPKDATLSTGVDYIGGYALVANRGDGGAPFYTFPANPKLTAGEACKGAADKPACLSELVKFEPTAGGTSSLGWTDCQAMCEYMPVQVRVTKGDAVSVIAEAPEGVVSSYLPIDTASEALARVSASRRYGSVGCTGKDVLREPGGSYLVHASSSGCKSDVDFKNSKNFTDDYVLRVAADGTISVVATHHTESATQGCAVAGRRPEGLLCSAAQHGAVQAGAVASYLAKMAHLEAASVVAFAQMERELTQHGAPAELIQRARSAREDEVRHAKTMSQYALAAGAVVAPVEVAQGAAKLRSLFEIALENIVEGCVRETFGALVAHRQAATATSEAMRFAMRRIAQDETEHAALSWDLHAWLLTQLTRQEREAVEAAFEGAAAHLLRDAQNVEPSEVRATLGLPDASESRTLAKSLVAGLRRDVAA